MTVPPPITRRSIDQLENDLVGLSKRVNASEYQFLVLLREFDLRQGWKGYLFNHCAEWLNFKCGMHPNTGREKVRVAHGLWDLPLMSGAPQTGELSYSKARALTRVATPANEEGFLDYALSHTAEQVENHCRALRNGMRDVSTRDANRIHKSRYLSSCRHGDGRMTISVELSQEDGELVLKPLERAMADREREDRSVEHESDTSAEVPAVDTQRSDLPIEAVRRLCCDAGLVALTEDDHGNPLQLSRKYRVVQPTLRRALLARDQCCCFPGCTHTRWLDAHHIQHWVDGGETSLENTMLLCKTHHRLLHEGGFSIKELPG